MAPPSQAIARGGWYALVLVALTNAMSLLDRQILAILAPAIKHDLGVGDAEMGLLYGTVFALFYALFSLPLGRLVDGWVRTRLLAICIFAWSLFAGMSAFASGFGLLAISRRGREDRRTGSPTRSAIPALFAKSLLARLRPPAWRGSMPSCKAKPPKRQTPRERPSTPRRWLWKV